MRFIILLCGVAALLAACGEDRAAPQIACVTLEAGAPAEIAAAGINIDQHEVTNGQFRAFVEATGYLTRAERGLPEEIYNALPETARVPGSAVFTAPSEEGPLNPARWWSFVPGANWKHPEGPGSSIEGRDDYPVVHIAYEDAEAYALAKFMGDHEEDVMLACANLAAGTADPMAPVVNLLQFALIKPANYGTGPVWDAA